LFELAASAQSRGWSAEELLSTETKRRERDFRRSEKTMSALGALASRRRVPVKAQV
jgi:hypothetical protein